MADNPLFFGIIAPTPLAPALALLILVGLGRLVRRAFHGRGGKSTRAGILPQTSKETLP